MKENTQILSIYEVHGMTGHNRIVTLT